MTERIGYKVLTEDRRSLIMSFNMNFITPLKYNHGHHYKKNKTIKPRFNCGPLAVFNTWDNASNFKTADEIVVRCKFTLSTHINLWIDDEHKKTGDFPTGTMFADSVTCLE